MNALDLVRLGSLILSLCVFRCMADEAVATMPPPVPSEELPDGSQILASGPVHEAFAKPVSVDPQVPVVVPKQPPAALQEVPPSEKPVGDGIVWVPGYWAWDADRDDFIWVSGCWRLAPPNTYWVPGYWLQAGTGWQWMSGFWKPLSSPPQTIEYLPVPPATPEETEVVTADDDSDQAWVPGCWYWVNDRYVWRRGFWITQRVGWVWVPSHYVWTPRGYLFCAGHWDYDMDRRGVLFTPAYFPPAVRVRAGFVFCPSLCLDLGVLRLNLFAYPRYRHYYFGDYYDDAYLRIGIYPWFQCWTTHVWYDPLFGYDRWRYRRTEPRWVDDRRRDYELRRDHRDQRPPRTVTVAQLREPERHGEKPLVRPLGSYAASRPEGRTFERVSAPERQQWTSRAADVRSFREQRERWEAPSSSPSVSVRNAGERSTESVGRSSTPSVSVRSSETRRFEGNSSPSASVRQTERASSESTPSVSVRSSETRRFESNSSPSASVRQTERASSESTPSVSVRSSETRRFESHSSPAGNVRSSSADTPVRSVAQPSVQPEPVRVTRPERETVTVPSTRGPSMSVSRDIPVRTVTPDTRSPSPASPSSASPSSPPSSPASSSSDRGVDRRSSRR